MMILEVVDMDVDKVANLVVDGATFTDVTILIEDSGDGDVVMKVVHMEVDKVTDMMVDMDENGRRWMQWIKMNNGG